MFVYEYMRTITSSVRPYGAIAISSLPGFHHARHHSILAVRMEGFRQARVSRRHLHVLQSQCSGCLRHNMVTTTREHHTTYLVGMYPDLRRSSTFIYAACILMLTCDERGILPTP
jgi:hypothetical protein